SSWAVRPLGNECLTRGGPTHHVVEYPARNQVAVEVLGISADASLGACFRACVHPERGREQPSSWCGSLDLVDTWRISMAGLSQTLRNGEIRLDLTGPRGRRIEAHHRRPQKVLAGSNDAPPAGFEPALTAPETMCGVAVTPAVTCRNVPTILVWADVLS